MAKIINDLYSLSDLLDKLDMHHYANIIKQTMVMLGDKTHRVPVGDIHTYKELQPGTKFRFVDMEYAPDAYCVKKYDGRYYIVEPYTVSKSTEASPDAEVILVSLIVVDK